MMPFAAVHESAFGRRKADVSAFDLFILIRYDAFAPKLAARRSNALNQHTPAYSHL
jgi:hypothetical protein